MSDKNTIHKEDADVNENLDQNNIDQDEQKSSQSQQKEDNNIKEEDVKTKEESENSESSKDTQEKELSEEEKLKLEVDVQKDKYLRLFAEFENYKRRTSKERIELFKTAGQEVMQSLLPVLDDFDRASKEISKSDDKDAIKGVELIHSKLRDTLKAKGLEEMSVKIGDTFDGDLHEAITQVPAPEDKLKGKIIDIVEKGYTLGEKIIRYPKVVTGK